MILVLKAEVSSSQIVELVSGIRGLGFNPEVVTGFPEKLICVAGDSERLAQLNDYASSPHVARVISISSPFRLTSKEFRETKTVVKISDSFAVGGENLVVIAGPCAVESEEQILTVARACRFAGASALRGGAFKPRTSTYSFQGLGEEGLKLLAVARAETGLRIVTEALDVQSVELVARYADVLQIGARNMQNTALLKEAARTGKPVILKRGIMATIDEFLSAAEYILLAGNPNVILCERGIRTFETATRNTLDLNAIPVLNERTHLPVLVDPSHGTGVSSYVGAMSKAAVAAGADGLLIEVHPNPAAALSDGEQSLSIEEFETLVPELRVVAAAVGRSLGSVLRNRTTGFAVGASGNL